MLHIVIKMGSISGFTANAIPRLHRGTFKAFVHPVDQFEPHLERRFNG